MLTVMVIFDSDSWAQRNGVAVSCTNELERNLSE